MSRRKSRKRRDRQLEVYLSKDKSVSQIIRPKMFGRNGFQGDWGGLAKSVNRGRNYGFRVI